MHTHLRAGIPLTGVPALSFYIFRMDLDKVLRR